MCRSIRPNRSLYPSDGLIIRFLSRFGIRSTRTVWALLDLPFQQSHPFWMLMHSWTWLLRPHCHYPACSVTRTPVPYWPLPMPCLSVDGTFPSNYEPQVVLCLSVVAVCSCNVVVCVSEVVVVRVKSWYVYLKLQCGFLKSLQNGQLS